MRSTTRLADASAETSTSLAEPGQPGLEGDELPGLRAAVAALAGHGVDQVAAGAADPQRADLDQVTGQGALGDLDAVGGQQLGQLGLGPDLVRLAAAR